VECCLDWNVLSQVLSIAGGYEFFVRTGCRSMLIALAQLNPIVGDLQGNLSQVRKEVEAAARKGARLVVFPELAISGYPPKDLLLKEGFVEACDRPVGRESANRSRRLGGASDAPLGSQRFRREWSQPP
jgi:NAD+ synthase (glutamine-hydrolysing)